MNGRWLLANRDFLVRDLVRDYCTVYSLLADQRRRFDVDGAVSYTALRDLLGEAMRKGVFWRLKDTAHHLFRNSPGMEAMAPGGMPAAELPLLEEAPAESRNTAELEQINALRRHADNVLPGGALAQKALEGLIDWCIGYAFHECAKLKEDAFQGQHYANRLIQISRSPAVTADMYNPLRGLGGQTSESSSRELSRIMHVLGHGLRLLTSYLSVERHNTHLTRWLASEEDFARRVFGPGYDHLLASLFGNDRERLYLMAARDFLNAGRREPAQALLARAKEGGNLGQEGIALLHELENETAAEGESTDVCAACGKKNPLPCLPYLNGQGRGCA